MQGIGGIESHIAVDIIAVVASPVAGVGVREGRPRTGAVIAGQRGDVACAVVGDCFLGESVGGGPVVVILPGGQTMRTIVSEGVSPGGLAVLGPGPGGDVARVAGGRTGLNRSVVAQGHREDVGLAVAGALDSRSRAEPALDVPGVGGGVVEKNATTPKQESWRKALPER